MNIPFIYRKKLSEEEKKRKDISSVVKHSVGRMRRLRTKVDWDDLFDGTMSCGYVRRGKHGNIFSIYAKDRVVELSLFNEKYMQEANRFCGALARKGYAVGMSTNYAARDTPHNTIYKD